MGGNLGDFESTVEEIDYLLRHTSYIVRRRGRDILSDFDITPPQFNALVTLIRHGDLTMGALCRRLYLASSTVTDLIDRMERDDLVERVRDDKDRRVIRLHVKPKGHQLLKKVMAARLRYLNKILDSLSDQQQEVLLSSLHRLYELMTKQETKDNDDDS